MGRLGSFRDSFLCVQGLSGAGSAVSGADAAFKVTPSPACPAPGTRRDKYPRLCRIYLPISVFKGIFPGSNHWLYLQPAAVVCSVLWLPGLAGLCSWTRSRTQCDGGAKGDGCRAELAASGGIFVPGLCSNLVLGSLHNSKMSY